MVDSSWVGKGGLGWEEQGWAGRVWGGLGGDLGPSWLQVAFGSRFGHFLAALEGPRWSQDGSKMRQDEPSWDIYFCFLFHYYLFFILIFFFFIALLVLCNLRPFVLLRVA